MRRDHNDSTKHHTNETSSSRPTYGICGSAEFAVQRRIDIVCADHEQ